MRLRRSLWPPHRSGRQMTLQEVRTPHDSPARRFSPQELSAGRAVLGNSFPIGRQLDYAARPVPSIQLVGIDGLASNGRDRSSEQEVGLLGGWTLFARAVTIAAARAHGSAQHALEFELAHEFAHISDAIGQDSAAGGGIAILNGGELRQRRSLSPVAPASPTAILPLLLGSRRATIVPSFLRGTHILVGMDKGGIEFFPANSNRLNAAFGGGANLVTTLGDQAFVSPRDILSHPRVRNQTIQA